MVRFNYESQVVERVIIPMTHMERRALIEAPISIQHYGGSCCAGHCHTHEYDTAYARYMRAYNRMHNALGMRATQDDGYLP